MKIAVIIDPKKISRLKRKISTKNYVDHAIKQLAYELSMMFR